MPKYRVTLRMSSVEVVEAENPYMAAIIAAERHGNGVEVADVRPAVGRSPAAASTKKATKTTKKRQLSPETRAKLAQNLAKARAARARKLKAAKRTAKRR